MRHLIGYKLFESITSGYEEITRDEYNLFTIGDGDSRYEWVDPDNGDIYYNDVEFIKNNWVPFTDNDLKSIKQLLPDAEYVKILTSDTEDARIENGTMLCH